MSGRLVVAYDNDPFLSVRLAPTHYKKRDLERKWERSLTWDISGNAATTTCIEWATVNTVGVLGEWWRRLVWDDASESVLNGFRHCWRGGVCARWCLCLCISFKGRVGPNAVVNKLSALCRQWICVKTRATEPLMAAQHSDGGRALFAFHFVHARTCWASMRKHPNPA